MSKAKKLLEDYRSLGEAIPQEQLKRAEVRKDKRPTSDIRGSEKLGMKPEDVIGWFNTSSNVLGWPIFAPSAEDKKEFGNDVLRIFSPNTQTTTVVKFNLLSGTVSFIDNEHLMNTDEVKFKTPSAYRSLMIDQNKKAFDTFGII